MRLQTAILLLCTLSTAPGAFAGLEVRETTRGTFDVVLGGRPVITNVRPLFGTSEPPNVRRSFSTVSDGSKVWNAWCEEAEGRFRFEVVERHDGAVELSMIGSGGANEKNRKRGIDFALAPETFRGQRWEAFLGQATDVERGSGTFDGAAKTFFTRYLASAGLVFDFNPLGPADMGGLTGYNCILGGWQVSTAASGITAVTGMANFDLPYGGFGGMKLVLHEGTFADYEKDHFYAFFAYEQPLPVARLVKFGAPKAGKDYVDGDIAHDESRGFGWVGEVPRTLRVGHGSGAYYSHAAGRGRAVYRFAGLVDGYYVATVQVGNYTGEANNFSVSLAGDLLADGISVAPRKARTLARMVHVSGGSLEVVFDGDWIVSAIGLQPRMTDAEDFSVRRGFWYVDGYEPCAYYHSETYRAPLVCATLDETVDMPVPGCETSVPWRTPPRPVELPDMQSPVFDWTYRMKMWRLLTTGSSMEELADDGFRERLFADNVARNRYNVVMVNGMLSRHTFSPARMKAGQELVARFAKSAHRHGMKYLDHLDATLLWNMELGFRTMATRLPEILRNYSNNLPAFQLCVNNPETKRKLFAYVREQAQAGADGFQLDEVLFYAHGCTCRHCRERFAAETGWQLPLDETDPALDADSGSTLSRRWNQWKSATEATWFVELRRYLKDIRPNLFLSSYHTLKNFTLSRTKASKHFDYKRDDDPAERGRVMNMFGNEVMTENTLGGYRPVLPLMRLKNVMTIAFDTPVWNWFHDHNKTCSYFSWGLANLCGQISFLSPNLPDDPSVPDPEAWAATSRPLDVKGVTSPAEVAILFSVPSRNYNVRPGYAEEMLGLAQELDAMHVPYEFLWNGTMDEAHLAKYKVVLLGDAQCLSDAEIAALRTFEAKGGRVCGRPGAGSRDDVGQPRAEVPRFVEMPSAAPFCAEELITWQSLVWRFAPDTAAQAAFRAKLSDLVGGATWWQVSGAPEKVLMSVLREKSGATVIQLLNATGANLRPGDTLSFDAPTVPFPPLVDDIRIDLPSSVGTRAVAYSPDFGSEGRPLEIISSKPGRVMLHMPKELLQRYVLIRLQAH